MTITLHCDHLDLGIPTREHVDHDCWCQPIVLDGVEDEDMPDGYRWIERATKPQ